MRNFEFQLKERRRRTGHETNDTAIIQPHCPETPLATRTSAEPPAGPLVPAPSPASTPDLQAEGLIPPSRVTLNGSRRNRR